jgi:uncharacterized pyridoxamine 5'-phosphate oxidase family protein
MNKTVEFLKECKTFYVATLQGDQPRVRPFGAVAEINGKVYLATSSKKAVYRQMMDNPNIEISGLAPNGKWIRVTGKVAVDDSRDAKVKMLEAYPNLTSLYSPDDGYFAVVYLIDAVGKIETFGRESENYAIE